MANFTPTRTACLGLLLFVLFLPSMLHSQAIERGLVGSAKDQNGHALAGVNLQLTAELSPSFNEWAVSDSVGRFVFDALQPGRFILNASLIGFAIVNDTIIVQGTTSEKLTYELVMKESASELKAVTVTSRKEAIEIDKGKLIYNVGNSATSAGSSALDLLRKLPGVSIGQDDQIMLKGAGGINVMIDGKMTYLSEQQLVQLLRSMSGESGQADTLEFFVKYKEGQDEPSCV
ncbi:carboxypeptidase-like regulatory domain-containing protein [Dyadobacter crusticola]|uniref:carboxypeptidase-like regulatory domain-containing protein n=1 Tax=Dyadobacter crusticola TaxID=292407 RepID=UPI0004E19B78|nr:carboxypeptidase-like regulatory domain-containing protein [Dyadobacter crusticola]